MPIDIVRVGGDVRSTTSSGRCWPPHASDGQRRRNSGASVIAVYGEVEDDQVSVFVRDTGRGFDPAGVPTDRGGIAESIVGRMQRHGGVAVVRPLRPGLCG